MKASELRLGNYVISKSHNGMLTTVRGIFISEIRLDANPLATYKPTDLEPVPLTKEILSKAWFEYEDGDFINGLWKLKPDYQKGEIIGYGLFVKLLDWTRTNQNSIKYLHQLQNLFFAINGEELIIDSYAPVERKQMQDKLDKALNEL